MPAIPLTTKSFQETLEKPGIVLLDFWAAWCGPCRNFAPIFEKAADKHPDIVFGKVDTEAEGELAAAFEIRSIPTLMVFRDGVMLFAQPGALAGNVLEELIQKVREIDMDAVRKEIAAHEANQPEAAPSS